MISKLIIWILATSELNEWSNVKTGLIITLVLVVSLLLLPVLAAAVCIRAMFIKQ